MLPPPEHNNDHRWMAAALGVVDETQKCGHMYRWITVINSQ